MLYITTDKYCMGLQFGIRHKFDLNNEDDRALITTTLIDNVVSIKADEDDLAFIRRHFSNIRMTVNAIEVIWVGEEANFIVKNIILAFRK